MGGKGDGEEERLSPDMRARGRVSLLDAILETERRKRDRELKHWTDFIFHRVWFLLRRSMPSGMNLTPPSPASFIRRLSPSVLNDALPPPPALLPGPGGIAFGTPTAAVAASRVLPTPERNV